jgi:cytochrome c553
MKLPPQQHCSTPAVSAHQQLLSCRLGPWAVAGVFVLGVIPFGAASEPPDSRSGNARPTEPARVTFATDVSPIVHAKCVRCHGEKTRKADLDLRTAAGLLKGGESGAVVIPGKPDKSPLYEKVHAGAMPPDGKARLNLVEIETIRRWIESGAVGEAAAAALTQHDVVPILLRACATCHGLRRQEGGLDLRTKTAMLRGGKSGPAIVPGRPGESRVIQKTRAGEMPPRDRLVEASVKPIEPSEADALERWIAAGAPEVTVKPDVATTTPDPLVTDQDRDFWAFRPPTPVATPAVHHATRIRNAIDAFVLEKMERRGLSFASEADRVTLMRRAYFDLTGLPPDPTEVQALLADSAPDAYERMIDRLLASPRYAERWGRYWLDLAGYADSEGKREQDLPRPHAWRYRDYVIRAFNNDKPYDRFLLEQIAGDELADYEHAPEITPEIHDNLVATGFLRMAPDPTWANITAYLTDRIDVIADEIDVLGSAVMGLTLKCARCHDHKYDPLPQRDYYRLLDVFKGAYDEHDWLKPHVKPGLGPVSQDGLGSRHLPWVTTAERKAWETQNKQLQRDIDLVQSALDGKTGALTAKYLDERLAKLPAALRDDLRAMLATAPNKRDTVQTYLAEKFEKELRIDRATLKTLDPEFKKEAEEIEGRLKALQSRRVPGPAIHALWDRGQPSPTYIYRRGNPQNPGRLVGPGVPSVLTDGKTPFDVTAPWPGAATTGRRLAFAQWLTRPDHPLTARVAVNRLWKHHFGRGIVKTLGNFGKAGAAPTHPELLDWLAREFVASGWSVKAMHRLMMTSATYRQSSAVTPDRATLDPDNTLLSRMPLTRMDAEALYDTLLVVAGRLNEARFGPGDPVEARGDGLVTPIGAEHGWRRAVYVRQSRKQLPTHLENFDYPQMNPNCVERRDSTVSTQALHLMNNGTVHDLAAHFARRVHREAGTDPAKQVERTYQIALSRHPSDEEMRIGVDALTRLAEQWADHCGGGKAPDQDAIGLKALATYCHATINSAGFLYVD